jgi:transcriptional regulator with XRE-family HTH domain
MVMTNDGDRRRELAKFLRSRRERIAPNEVGLPVGPRRRTLGLRREEVAVLAGLSPTWYTYLEQGRDIQPSREVLDSLANVLRLSEDERRYIHRLAHTAIELASPLDAGVNANDLVRQLVSQFVDSPYPVYASTHRCDLMAWNRAACEWYEDWGAMPAEERNIMHWLLLSPVARERLVDWESVTRDAVARWRAESARHPDDPLLNQRIAELRRRSPHFGGWWDDHDVLEHRSGLRHFRHGHLGVQAMRIVPLQSPELVPTGIVVHLPVQDADGIG